MTFDEWVSGFPNKDFFDKPGFEEIDRFAFRRGMQLAFVAGKRDALENQWVSVNDRLPEEGQRVDVMISINLVHDLPNERVTDLYFMDGKFYKYDIPLNPTHWMPIPEAPK